MLITDEDVFKYICDMIVRHSSNEEEAMRMVNSLIERLPYVGWKTRIVQHRAQLREQERATLERRKNRKGRLNPEFPIVQAQCLRAKKAGAPYSLTLEQWLLAIEYFNGKCAYCQAKPYQALEHFLSLPLGGTTADNCVPACHACNNRKRNRLPEQLPAYFPKKNLDRIYEFLAMQKTAMENT